jgi:hypothetical protein
MVFGREQLGGRAAAMARRAFTTVMDNQFNIKHAIIQRFYQINVNYIWCYSLILKLFRVIFYYQRYLLVQMTLWVMYALSGID